MAEQGVSLPPQRAEAERTLGLSIAMAGVRCVIKYMILPFGLPILGISADLAAPISLLLGVVALASIIWSVRRLWQMNYAWKWPYLGLGVVSMLVVVVFVVNDLQGVLG